MQSKYFYDKGTNPLIDMYLEYVEDTESPRIYHIWSLIAGVSACLGRRVSMPFGHGQMWPNMYVVLVGPPAMRKSTAINLLSGLLKVATGIRFAPDDTAGQRQGLVAEMVALEDDENVDDIQKATELGQIASLDALSDISCNIPDPRDRHVLFASASEFTTFIGNNNIDMLTFLGKAYDCEDYVYRLRKSRDVVKNPLMSMLAGSTPTSIAGAMPAEATGQGFMSRLILVWGAEKHRKIFMPSPPDERLKDIICGELSFLSHQFEGTMAISTQAFKYMEDLYHGTDTHIQDTRFVYYEGRRDAHLRKLAFIFASMRRSLVIELKDALAANRLLRYTEAYMPEALGEYGLSPLASAKQKMLEFLQAAKGPVPMQLLQALMERDMRMIDFHNALYDLCNSGKLKAVNLKDGNIAYIFMDNKKALANRILEHLAEQETEDAATHDRNARQA